MADVKILYVNTDGLYEEHDEAADSVKALSFKTANHTLTDAALGDLIDGGDSGGHTHDDRYFQESEFITTSAGAGDSGKPVALDAAGHIDATMVNDADIDHGSIGGLGDDDHTIYTLADGSRNFSAKVSYASHPTFSSDTEIVDKKYVDDVAAGLGTSAEWQESVIDRLATPPGSPSTGDRYLVIATATGDWSGQEDDIAEYNGATWDFTTPVTGTYVSVDDEADGLYYFGGSSWIKKFYEATTASLGVEKVGLDIRLDLLASGGLKLTGSEVGVEPADFAGTGLQDDGADNLEIAFGTSGSVAVSATTLASTSNGDGAALIGVEDSAANFTGTDVEAVLAELAALISGSGVDYTVGVGGVTIGDALKISANNTVVVHDGTGAEQVVGIAASTVSASGSVTSMANDVVLSGASTGETAGTKVYWDGSALTTTIPTTSNLYVWRVGTWKNATDLHVQVEFVKRNV